MPPVASRERRVSADADDGADGEGGGRTRTDGGGTGRGSGHSAKERNGRSSQSASPVGRGRVDGGSSAGTVEEAAMHSYAKGI